MSNSTIVIALVVVLVAIRLAWRFLPRKKASAFLAAVPKKPLNPLQKNFYTVYIFAKLNTRRYFRDRTAIFFTVAFPLIFLFVCGGIFGGKDGASFRIALINQ